MQRGLDMTSHCRAIAAVLMLAGFLTACVSYPTPYQPQDRSGYGYDEQRIETDRFRVSFFGNSQTNRATVETYLLFRAAELTLETGNDYFIVQDQETERRDQIFSTFVGQRHRGLFYRIYGGYYWHDDFLYYDRNYRVVERYEATAFIKTFSGETPEDDVRAYDARDVIATLRDQVLRPGEPLSGS